MNAAQSQKVIEFDNLVRPTQVVGELTRVTAVTPPADSFVNKNAPGLVRQVKDLEEISECSVRSGERLLAMLKA